VKSSTIKKHVIHNEIYEALVDNLGKEGARNWADSAVKTFEDGVYDTPEELIQSTIEEAQK